jgi:hypothetical protein
MLILKSPRIGGWGAEAANNEAKKSSIHITSTVWERPEHRKQTDSAQLHPSNLWA